MVQACLGNSFEFLLKFNVREKKWSVSLEEIPCFLPEGNKNCMAHLVLLFPWVPGSLETKVLHSSLIKHQHWVDVFRSFSSLSSIFLFFYFQ